MKRQHIAWVFAMFAFWVPSELKAAEAPRPAGGTEASSELRARLTDRKISFAIKNAKLTDAMAVFAREANLSVVADAYAPDVPVAALNIEEVPLSVAVVEVANLYRRQAHLIDGVLVLRHQQWVGNARFPYQGDAFNRLPNSAGELAADKKGDAAQTVSGLVRNTPATDVARQVSRAVGVKLSIQAPLGSRPISVCAVNLSPTQLAGALGFLLNGSPEIAIRQSPMQRAVEEEIARQLLDRRTESEKVSDDLKKELSSLLTPANLQELRDGKGVSFEVDKMPAPLRMKAQHYVDVRWARVSSNVQGIELDRSSGLRVTISPDPSQVVLIYSNTTDGLGVHF